VRRRRWNVPKSGATPCTDSGAYTEPDANSDANPHADANSNANTHTNAHAWWGHDGDHHVRRRVTEDANRPAGDTRDIREQRHAGTRDGFQSASGAHRLS